MALKRTLLVFIIIITLLLVTITFFLPRVPGDVRIAKAIQHYTPPFLGWANTVTSSVSFPFLYILIAFTFFMAWLIKDIRASILLLLGFGGLWGLDKLLRLFIHQPRPSASLIMVGQSLPGSAFPSTAALLGFAIFGFLVMLINRSEKSFTNTIISLFCIFYLIIIFLARVTLGAHWPSDIITSYLLGYLWILFLMQFIKVKEK